MKRKMFLAAMLMAIGLQTSQAQFMRVWQNGKADTYDVSMVDSVQFVDAKYEWVDLGLPSGTLWATFNVGAFSPEEYGDYFAWGETETKDDYSWQTYKHCYGSYNSINKYCIQKEYGANCFMDYLTELVPEDDAARAAWGDDWEMPSLLQFDELIYREYTTIEDVYDDQQVFLGAKITSKFNGNSIFLPAAGHRIGTALEGEGQGFYLTRSLSLSYSCDCYSFDPNSISHYLSGNSREHGCSVRPVRSKPHVKAEEIVLDQTQVSVANAATIQLKATVLPENTDNKWLVWESSDETVAAVNSTGWVTGISDGTCTIICRTTDGSGVYAECQVTVETHDPSIELDYTSIYMVVDETRTLTATLQYYDPIPPLIWFSSDNNVATVDENGNVTAIAPGTCYIKCRPDDQSGLDAECQVTVQNYFGYTDGYRWSNLGLPSGTLWATANVGANSPEVYGDYFAWGETEPKESYSWATYKYCNGTRTTMTKYCQKSEYGYNGYTDTLTVLQPEDDAATVNWGSGWQTPSDEQFRELLDSRYTNVSPKELNGVKGLEIRGKTSHMSIFLPFAGQNAVSFIGKYGYYWTSTLDSSYVTGSIMFTCAENLDWSTFSVYYRYFGLSVRPVVRKQ